MDEEEELEEGEFKMDDDLDLPPEGIEDFGLEEENPDKDR
jgi:hypothetical protein